MKIINTKFAGLKVIQNFTFLDKRGYFKELIVEKKIKKKFPFNVMSFSKKNVLRGMHLQTKKSQGKYISVVKGEILDVVVDLRKNSKTFKKHFISRLSNTNGDGGSTYMCDCHSAGYFNTTSAIDEISFKFGSGNIDAGDICLYGIA